MDGGTLASQGTKVQVAGSYTQKSGALKLALSSTTAGTLAVAGHAALAGELNVGFINGYSPKAGEQIVVLSAKGVHNRFAKVMVDGFAKSSVSYGDTSVTITLAH